MDPAARLQQYYVSILNSLPAITQSYVAAADDVKILMTSAKTGIEELNQQSGDEIKRLPYVRESYHYFRETNTAVSNFLTSVNALLQKLEGLDHLRGRLQQGDTNTLIKFTEELRTILNDCHRKYQVFCERSRSFATTCNQAATECDKKYEEEKGKKNITQAVGGTATAAVAAGGLAATILVGVFTAGIGLAVGLPLTIAGTAVAATAAGTTTAVIAHIFQNAAQSFRRIGNTFNRCQREINTVGENLMRINNQTQEWYQNMPMGWSQRKEITTTITAIYQKVTETREVTRDAIRCTREIETVNNKITQTIN